MAEPETTAHDLMAGLADQIDAHRPPDGFELVKAPHPGLADQAASSTPTPLFSESESGEFRSRWSSIQTRFVDEPRRTVEDADTLETDVVRFTIRREVRE